MTTKMRAVRLTGCRQLGRKLLYNISDWLNKKNLFVWKRNFLKYFWNWRNGMLCLRLIFSREKWFIKGWRAGGVSWCRDFLDSRFLLFHLFSFLKSPHPSLAPALNERVALKRLICILIGINHYRPKHLKEFRHIRNKPHHETKKQTYIQSFRSLGSQPLSIILTFLWPLLDPKMHLRMGITTLSHE